MTVATATSTAAWSVNARIQYQPKASRWLNPRPVLFVLQPPYPSDATCSDTNGGDASTTPQYSCPTALNMTYNTGTATDAKKLSFNDPTTPVTTTSIADSTCCKSKVICMVLHGREGEINVRLCIRQTADLLQQVVTSSLERFSPPTRRYHYPSCDLEPATWMTGCCFAGLPQGCHMCPY